MTAAGHTERPARGCLFGIALGVVCWLVLFVVVGTFLAVL